MKYSTPRQRMKMQQLFNFPYSNMIKSTYNDMYIELLLKYKLKIMRKYLRDAWTRAQ